MNDDTINVLPNFTTNDIEQQSSSVVVRNNDVLLLEILPAAITTNEQHLNTMNTNEIVDKNKSLKS